MFKALKEIFKTNKDKIAYIINDERITYGELYDRAENYSELLKRQGTRPVIIYGHKSIDMFVSLVSCVFSGRAYVPVNIGTPEERFQKIIVASNAELIIANETLETNFSVENVTLGELEKYKNSKFTQCKAENETAYIIFTSGSTGEPKGVPISRDNLMNFVSWISMLKPLNEFKNAVVLNQASFSFDLSVADIFYSLFNGHTLVCLDRDTQNSYTGIFDVIERNKVNIMVMTPTFIKMCLLNSQFNSENYPSVKCMYFCGEMLDKKTVERIFSAFGDVSVINAYGPTEATSAVSGILITEDMLREDKSLPVGEISTAAVEIDISDGEIVLKGKSVFSGYLNNIDGGHFYEDGLNCYKTGDMGCIEGNRLYCFGRKDNQIKFKGYRIELDDIEQNIGNIKGVTDCAVVSKSSENNSVKTIKAFVVSEDFCDEEYIRCQLKQKLPDYMIPKIIKRVERLPVNGNGKTDRKLLSEL